MYLPPWTKPVRLKGGTRYRAQRSIDGTRRYGPLRATPAEAYADAVAFAAKAPSSDRPIYTLEQAVAATREDLSANRTEGTLRFFNEHAAVLLRAWKADWPLDKISADDIKAFMAKRSKSVGQQTVLHDLRTLSRILGVARLRGWMTGDPLATVAKPRQTKVGRIEIFTPAEVGSVVRAIRLGDEADADLVALAFLTGLRRAEIGRLQAEDVDLRAGRLFVKGKTSPRELPVGEELREVLARMLLRARAGGALVRGGHHRITKVFRKWAVVLKQPRLRPHVCRHTFGSTLASAGVKAHAIANLMGHASLRMAMRYLHPHSDELREAMGAVTTRGTRAGAQSPAQEA